MKKLVLLLLVPICFACSKEDDPAPAKDLFETKLIGTWQFHKMVEDGEVIEMGPCISQTTYEFTKDGFLNVTSFFPNELDDKECEEVRLTGFWEYMGENKIKYTAKDDPTDSDVQEFVFSENYTVLSFTTEYDDGMIETISLIKV